MTERISKTLLYESDAQHELRLSASWAPGEALYVSRILEQEEDERGPAYDSDMTYVVAPESVPAFLLELPVLPADVVAAIEWASSDAASARQFADAARKHGESRSNWFWIH